VEARQHDDADKAGIQRNMRIRIRLLPGMIGRVILSQTQEWLGHSALEPGDLKLNPPRLEIGAELTGDFGVVYTYKFRGKITIKK
jgi:hypothetical protein